MRQGQGLTLQSIIPFWRGRQQIPHCPEVMLKPSDGHVPGLIGTFVRDSGRWRMSPDTLRGVDVVRGWVCIGGLIHWCFLSQAADRLVCAHLPDRETEEEPEPQHNRSGGHPAGHPEG